MEEKREQKLIDIDGILYAKNPKLFKVIPRFLVSYLKRIIHQDELNSILIENTDKKGVDFMNSVMEKFKMTINVNGFENIPNEGKYIFVSNHPLGGMESFALTSTIAKKLPKIQLLVNDILMYVENLKHLFIPINKHGGNSQDYFKNIENALLSDNQLYIFPAGMVSRKIKGKIIDLQWKKSFISMSIKHQRDVIPVHIDARNSNFFYNLARLRKLLGIKANFEMLYLADEFVKQKGKTITLTFGKPMPYTTFDKSKSQNEWAQEVRETVYKLKEAKG